MNITKKTISLWEKATCAKPGGGRTIRFGYEQRTRGYGVHRKNGFFFSTNEKRKKKVKPANRVRSKIQNPNESGRTENRDTWCLTGRLKKTIKTLRFIKTQCAICTVGSTTKNQLISTVQCFNLMTLSHQAKCLAKKAEQRN